MGLKQPATKVWEIPEPKPVTLPAPERKREADPVTPVTPRREPEKVPAGV